MINMALYINAGDGTFSKSPLLLPAPSVPFWTDLDNDNNLDLLVTGGATLYQNQGDSTFLPVSTGVPSGSAVFGDFDNDGHLDLVKSTDSSIAIPRSYFMKNTPSGFVEQDNVFSLTSCLALNFEDYDLDGLLDLRVQRLGATWTNALFLQRSNIFQLSSNPWPGELLLWSDFDNDGLPDALVHNHPGYSDNGVLLFLNKGGEFSDSPSILLTPFFVRDVSAADYDNDGYLDVFLNGTPNPGSGTYQTKLFHNEHNGAFSEVQHPFPNYDAVHVSWADVDNDGDLDTIFTGQPASGPYVTWLFKNTLSTTNPPPLAPTGLRANYTSEGLLIEWNQAFDPNQDGGLTYNLAVGTQPGTWDILNPMSHSDGRRKIVAKGNAGWRLSRLITGLPTNQPCFFTVQAIDNSFAGSPFAPVQNIYTTSLPQLNAPSLIDGMLQFTLLASPGEFYLLETSTDLKSWAPVISIDTAPVHIQAPIGSSPGMRYFRIHQRTPTP
jgi:hypothetical protein